MSATPPLNDGRATFDRDRLADQYAAQTDTEVRDNLKASARLGKNAPMGSVIREIFDILTNEATKRGLVA